VLERGRVNVGSVNDSFGRSTLFLLCKLREVIATVNLLNPSQVDLELTWNPRETMVPVI